MALFELGKIRAIHHERNGGLTSLCRAVSSEGYHEAADLRIGANVAYAHLNGEIDEVSIYNRALTAAEIQAILAAGSAGKCPPSADFTSPTFTNPEVSSDGVT